MIPHVLEIVVKNPSRHIDEIYIRDTNFYQDFKNLQTVPPDARIIYIIKEHGEKWVCKAI